jgi:hypothetical protein
MNKIWISSLIFSLLLTIIGCSPHPTNEVEKNYQESKSFVSSKVYDLDKWFQLDSIFNSSVYSFKSNEYKVKSEYISKVDSISSNYNNLTKEFYKNYFFNQLEKLESLVSSIDFNDKSSCKNFNDFFSKTTQEFFDLNEKITPETRKEISKKIGLIHADVIQNNAVILNENFKADFEDFKNQMKTTLQNLIN